MRIFLLYFSLIVLVPVISAQTKTTVKFNKDRRIWKTKEFRFSIIVNQDSLIVFNTMKAKNAEENVLNLPKSKDTIWGVFEFSSDSTHWEQSRHGFIVETRMRELVLNLNFSTFNRKEYLDEFILDKYFDAVNVKMVSVFEKKIGEEPIYMLVSNSDSNYCGVSRTGHFFGSIEEKNHPEIEIIGSFCANTMHAEPLLKNDTGFSWLPSFFEDDIFKFERRGEYVYKVEMVLKPGAYKVPYCYKFEGETFVWVRAFYVLEDEFNIE